MAGQTSAEWEIYSDSDIERVDWSQIPETGGVLTEILDAVQDDIIPFTGTSISTLSNQIGFLGSFRPFEHYHEEDGRTVRVDLFIVPIPSTISDWNAIADSEDEICTAIVPAPYDHEVLPLMVTKGYPPDSVNYEYTSGYFVKTGSALSGSTYRLAFKDASGLITVGTSRLSRVWATIGWWGSPSGSAIKYNIFGNIYTVRNVFAFISAYNNVFNTLINSTGTKAIAVLYSSSWVGNTVQQKIINLSTGREYLLPLAAPFSRAVMKGIYPSDGKLVIRYASYNVYKTYILTRRGVSSATTISIPTTRLNATRN